MHYMGAADDVNGGWRLAAGGWRLAETQNWKLAAGSWKLEATLS
jgi:hypothetical protein